VISKPLLDSFAKLRKATISFFISICLPVRVEQHSSHCTNFDETWYLSFFSKICRENSSSFKNPTRITDTLHEDVFTFMTISCWILLRVTSMLDKVYIENKNTHFMFNNFIFENLAVYEIISKNVVVPEGPLTTSQYGVRVACWISKPTCTHSQAQANAPGHTHARTRTHICNISFPRQQWFRERVSMLRYKHIVCLVL
jgi:hypothetical protein